MAMAYNHGPKDLALKPRLRQRFNTTTWRQNNTAIVCSVME